MCGGKKFGEEGWSGLGSCNGFQMLVESGLRPGALLRNRQLRFVCRPVTIRVETTNTPFTCAATPGQLIKAPVAHGEGCYFADQRVRAQLEPEDRVAMRYPDNPNGCLPDTAGTSRQGRTVTGLMAHPD